MQLVILLLPLDVVAGAVALVAAADSDVDGGGVGVGGVIVAADVVAVEAIDAVVTIC